MHVFRFCPEAALARISSHAADLERMKAQARSESLLMRLYDVRLPQYQSTPSGLPSDGPSVALLQTYSPWLLTRFQPLSVIGDGNCLFRALSLAVFGSEAQHILLRLMCVIEVLLNQALYDNNHAEFYAPFQKDPWLQLPSYCAFVTTLVQLNTDCDMLGVLAASTVLHKAIQTLWPLMVNPGELSPFSKLIVGRAVSNCRHPINIMWSTACYPMPKTVPIINHFVPLVAVSTPPMAVIDCDACDDVGVENTKSTVPVSGDPGDPGITATITDTDQGPATPVSNAQSASGGYPLPGNKNLSLADCLSILVHADESAFAGSTKWHKDERVLFD